MVYYKRHRQTFNLQAGLCVMEIVVLLLLTVPLAAAVPLAPAHTAGFVASDDSPQGSGEDRVPETEKVQHAPALKIVPFLPDKRVEDALKHRMTLKLRPPRAPQRGCQLGTCQLHNLANTLYHISKTNGKDESKKANDPQGYGR